MNPDIFLKKFGYLIQAKDGIKKLREIILQLAVSGKLIEQNLADEPAELLLKKMKKEKDLLIKKGEIRASKTLSKDIYPLFELPASWEWSFLGELTTVITDGTHHTPHYIESGIPFISVKDINGKRIAFENCRYISQMQHEEINRRCNPELGDILICRIGTLGRATIVDTDSPFSIFVSVGLLKFIQHLYIPKFAHIVLNSPLLNSQYQKIKAGGSHTNKLNLVDLPKLLLPVPPLEEQNKIVARVNQLMTVCDQLEAEQIKQKNLKFQAVNTTCHHITNTTTTGFGKAFDILNKKFSDWFEDLETVRCLRTTILQLAIQGKLVPQDPNDEPARCLLNKIKIEKDKLISLKKIKKINTKEAALDKIEPFTLPSGWEWGRLNELLSKLGAGSTPRGGKQVYAKEGVPFLRSQNVWNDGVKLDDVAFIKAETHAKMSGTHVYAGDLLFNITGGSIGRCAIVPNSFLEGNVSQHVTIIRPVFNDLTPYLHLVLVSEYVQKTVMDVQVGVSREGLSIGKLGQFIIPIPPLSEQERIVSKIKELLAICDQLEKNITKANDINVCLMDSLVYGIADIK